jgi:hypothetical protein
MCLLQFAPIRFFVAFVPSQNLFLRPKTAFNNFFRCILAGIFHFSPRNLQIPTLRPPAKQTLLRARVEGWRHLDAAVGLDTVKLLFVTYSTVDNGFVKPLAPFDRRVTSD